MKRVLPAIIAGATEGTLQSFASKLPFVANLGIDVTEVVAGYVLGQYVLKKGLGRQVADAYMSIGLARLGASIGTGLLGGGVTVNPQSFR